MKVYIEDSSLSYRHGKICEGISKDDFYFNLKTKLKPWVQFHPSWLQEVPKEIENEPIEVIELYFNL